MLWVRTVGWVAIKTAQGFVWLAAHPARALLTVLTVLVVLAPLGWL